MGEEANKLFHFTMNGDCVLRVRGLTGSDGGGGRKDAEGPNRMSESWAYSTGTRPIPQHDGNSASLSEDFNPSEIATDRLWKPDYNGACA